MQIFLQNLKSALDSATKGAIYFSLGAIQESEQLPLKMLQAIADAFRDLPFTVLWKIGNTTMFDKPQNVIAQSWFTQQEVLGKHRIDWFDM